MYTMLRDNNAIAAKMSLVSGTWNTSEKRSIKIGANHVWIIDVYVLNISLNTSYLYARIGGNTDTKMKYSWKYIDLTLQNMIRIHSELFCIQPTWETNCYRHKSFKSIQRM